MAKLCIPSSILDKIQGAIKGGKIDFKYLLSENTTSAERRAVWEKYTTVENVNKKGNKTVTVDKELARWINLKFEKASVSNYKYAMKNFIKEILTAKEKSSKKVRDIVSRVAELKEQDFFEPGSKKATLTDLMEDMMGIRVSPEQFKIVTDKAQNLQELKETSIDKDGLPTSAYFIAKEDLETWMFSQTPTHLLRVITGGIMRTNLLTIASGVVNQGSNTGQGLAQATEKRIATFNFKGLNNDFAIAYVKRGIGIYFDSGHGLSRNYGSHVKFGEDILHSEGPGVFRGLSRLQNKLVYKYLLGYMDEVSGMLAAADTLNLESTAVAKRIGLKGKEAQQFALELFKEAVKIDIDTSTPIGKMAFAIKELAVADAERSTWTNKGFLADKALNFRNWVNSLSGDAQLGFWNIPFVKTATNVIQFGIDSSLFGFTRPIYKFRSAWRAMNHPLHPDGKPMQDVMRRFVRAGMGTALSLLLVSLLEPDDFFSAYDAITTKEKEEMGIKKGTSNAVKIRGTWWSLDFFGPLGAGFVGMMYARKYGDGFTVNSAWQYSRGVGSQISNVPGLNFFEFSGDVLDAIKERDFYKATKRLSYATADSIMARILPRDVSAVARATDPYERKTDRDDILSKTQSRTPIWRKSLPKKINLATGEYAKSEGFFSTMLFGSRRTTAKENSLIKEISRLNMAGESPTMTNIEYGSSKVKELKKQLDTDFYEQALKWFSTEYGSRASEAIWTKDYRIMSNEKRKEALNKIRTKVRSDMLEKFGFRKNRGRK